MNAEVMKKRFDLLFTEISQAGLEDDLIAYLESDYELIDIDKARDQAREGRL